MLLDNFRRRITVLFLCMIWLVALSVFALDYSKVSRVIVESNETELGLIQSSVIQALTSVDIAYTYFDKDVALKMEKHTGELMRRYDQGEDPKDWDYDELKDRFGMDVYVLDDSNTVVYSSFKKDIGINFSECCTDFSTLLDERRNSGDFYHDGLDTQQQTGEIKKFSYQGTKDHKYIFELGYSLENDEIFESFSFLRVTREIQIMYDIVERIKVYNSEGYLLESNKGKKHMVDDSRLPHLREAFNTNKVVETESVEGEKTTYLRYVPYNNDKDKGISTSRVVEIEYNKERLHDTMETMRFTFYMQLLAFIIISIFLSSTTSRMVASPMYLAFHDSLTGLKNRAAYDSLVNRLINKKIPFGMILIDLDNFKNVNDVLGHEKGDMILKYVANIIKECVRDTDLAIRLGGDEFIVVAEGVQTHEDLSVVAHRIRERLTVLGDSYTDFDFECYQTINEIGVTMSIGGVLYPTDGLDIDELFAKVDDSMYESKSNGKDTYMGYSENKGDVD